MIDQVIHRNLSSSEKISVDVEDSYDKIKKMSVGSKIKHDIDGIDLTPALQGKQLDREALYWHYPHYSNQGGIPGGAVRIGDYKLFENYEDGKVSLYNLKKDIGETKDLSSSDPERVKSMRTKLHAWYKEVNAKFLQPKGESKNPWRP